VTLSGRGRRAKGVRGEHEVLKLFREHGFDVRGLEGLGDHYASKGRIRLHLECKRQERLRIPEWMRQCEEEAPGGTLPVLAYRRSHENWKVVMDIDDFFDLVL
jgi:Holliday junction resolvase